MSSPSSFLFGLVTGIAVMAVLGLLLGGSFGSTSAFGSTNTAQVPSAAPTPPAAAPSAPAPTRANVPPVTEKDHIRGDANAPLTWVEYSDFECPFCKSFHPTMTQMIEAFDGEVKWVYRHFPLSFHNPLATKAAEGSECADELGGNDAFWQFMDTYFERTRSNGNGLAGSELAVIALDIGLDVSAFTSCLESGRYAAHVQADIAGGQVAGVSGTPGSFLIDANGQATPISGAVPYAQVKASIEASL